MSLEEVSVLVLWLQKFLYRTAYNRTLWSFVRIKEGVLGVKVYGSRNPMSKRTGDIEVTKIPKGRRTSGVDQPWGQGYGGGQGLGTWRY